MSTKKVNREEEEKNNTEVWRDAIGKPGVARGIYSFEPMAVEATQHGHTEKSKKVWKEKMPSETNPVSAPLSGKTLTPPLLKSGGNNDAAGRAGGQLELQMVETKTVRDRSVGTPSSGMNSGSSPTQSAEWMKLIQFLQTQKRQD